MQRHKTEELQWCRNRALGLMEHHPIRAPEQSRDDRQNKQRNVDVIFLPARTRQRPFPDFTGAAGIGKGVGHKS